MKQMVAAPPLPNQVYTDWNASAIIGLLIESICVRKSLFSPAKIYRKSQGVHPV
jgi:hypothetical protein